MISVEELINKLLAGIDISADEQKRIMGLYLVSYHKAILELLMVMKGHDAEFIKSLASFFAKEVETLTPEQQKYLTEALEIHRDKTLAEMADIIHDKLPEKDKATFRLNLESL